MEQLSAFDASFLYLESPTAPQHIMAVLLVADGFDVDRFADVVQQRMHLVPGFQRRLVTVPFHLDAPYWHVDRDVDVHDHLHVVTCPAPGDLPALGEVVGGIGSRLLDRSRPLWELHVVQGLEGGRSAIVVKVHHSTMYGAAGIVSLVNLLDPTPRVKDVEPDATPAERDLGAEAMLTRAARHLLDRPIRAARFARGLGGHLDDLGRTAARAATGRGQVALPYSAPSTPINARLTAARRAGFAALPLEDVLPIRKHADVPVTVNDVVLTAVAGSLRHYLADHGGVPRRPLLASVPVHTGSGTVGGTDLLTALLVPLAIGEPDPVERLHRTAAAAVQSKSFTDALGHGIVGNALEVMPPPVLVAGARVYERWRLSALHPPLQSLIVSNVIGSPVPLYAAGTRVEAIFPLGPLIAGSGLNVTVVSHDGAIDIGVLGCPDLVTDVDAVATGIRDAFVELHDLVV